MGMQTSRRSSKQGGSMMSDINVTPLVDVMLVLLTVFIVTAPLLMNAVPVKLPKVSATPSQTQLKTAHVSVTVNGDVYLDDKPIAEADLESQLKQANSQSDYSVDIFADEKVPYGHVARVMAAIQRAGISKFSFVLLPDATKSAH